MPCLVHVTLLANKSMFITVLEMKMASPVHNLKDDAGTNSALGGNEYTVMENKANSLVQQYIQILNEFYETASKSCIKTSTMYEDSYELKIKFVFSFPDVIPASRD